MNVSNCLSIWAILMTEIIEVLAPGWSDSVRRLVSPVQGLGLRDGQAEVCCVPTGPDDGRWIGEGETYQ